MVKHVILWQLKDEYSAEQKAEIKAGIKANLESLQGKIPGLLEIKVNIEPLASSNVDLMLDSSFETEADLAAYQTNPLHVEAASYVRSVVETRLCLDFQS